MPLCVLRPHGHRLFRNAFSQLWTAIIDEHERNRHAAAAALTPLIALIAARGEETMSLRLDPLLEKVCFSVGNACSVCMHLSWERIVSES